MPDIFPQYLAYESDLVLDGTTDDVTLQEKIDFPVVVNDGGKLLVQEIIAAEVDLSGRPVATGTAGTVEEVLEAYSFTISKPSADHIVVTPHATAPEGQTIGNVNVIDRMQRSELIEMVTGSEGITATTGPYQHSWTRGGLGQILPQNHIWFNLYVKVLNPAFVGFKVGVKIWYRQRPMKQDEAMGLLASRIQLTDE